MEAQLSHLRPSRLSLPLPGRAHRFHIGRLELVLERNRSGIALLCVDGPATRTWSLGLAEDGELWLDCRVPRWPLQLGLQPTLLLVPGGRLRGYALIPLVPTLLWRTSAADELIATELLPSVLSAEWNEAQRTCVQRCSSPLLPRWPSTDGSARAVLPLWFRNDSARMQSPESLGVTLQDRELRSWRGQRVALPRRVRFDERGTMTVQSRAPGAGRPA